MFHYSYAANGDPSLDLLTAASCSAGQPIGQPPMNSPPPNHTPFLANLPIPTSSSLPSSNHHYFASRSSITRSLAHHAGAIPPDPAAARVPTFSSSPASSACDFLDFHHPEPVRRVYSAGDLQGMNYAQASAENCTQEGAAAAMAGRVGRYSAEERKERIERYRSKRNHRNFHKKITYACRKTLADSRPRVRGRFARNGEAEAETEAESSEVSYECYGHGATCDNGGGGYNNFDGSASGGGDEWLKQMQAALTSEDGEEERCYIDEDVWASLDSVFSMNLLS